MGELKKVIFAAGGTGGHIYPAIAIADELVKMNSRIEIKFIGAKGRIEEKIIPQNGYQLETIDVSGFKRSLNLKNILSVYKVIKALKESKKILKNFEPELVYGTGGFVSGPVLKAAQSMNILNVIEEGNFYPGITVKLLSPKADAVILNFEGTKKFLKRSDNTTVMSYPVRQNMQIYSRSEAAEFFGLNPAKKVLFAFGGSQGAGSINSSLLNCYKKVTDSGIQIIWQTGETYFEKVNSEVLNNKNIKVLKYIDKIDRAYSACDLVICRAGISTIMELAGFGLASILVPYPFASENHQEKNAQAVADKSAGEILLDKELNDKIEGTILDLINDENRLQNYRKNITSLADKNAAAKIAEMLIELVNKRKN